MERAQDQALIVQKLCTKRSEPNDAPYQGISGDSSQGQPHADHPVEGEREEVL